MRVFVTGASGWIGSALVPELLAAGHEVVGLARSDASAGRLAAAGAHVHRGTVDDLEALRAGASACDAVVHLAFQHEIAFTGGFGTAAEAERRAVEAFGEALAGSGRPLVIASGLLGVAPGRLAGERDGHDDAQAGHLPPGPRLRHATAEFALSLASRGVPSSIVRLAPTVHGDGDNGFMAGLVSIARAKGVSAYVGDGAQRWPAVHRLDAARLFRLALERATPGATWHAAADEGVPVRDVAQVIGRHLGVPVVAVPADGAGEHFGWLAGFVAADAPASSAWTRAQLGWQPAGPGLLEDLDAGHYFRRPA